VRDRYQAKSVVPIRQAPASHRDNLRRGHRIMVQVQSSWFPLVDRNPQKFMKIDEAQPADFQKATERVYHSAKLPSSLTVEELPAATEK
jgi:predicted acyl esterase